MKRILQKNFIQIIIIITLIATLGLAYGIISESQMDRFRPDDLKEDGTVVNNASVNINDEAWNYIGPDFREAIIVYFKEMPSSMKEFASSYDVKTIFVKDEIKMAAFETAKTKMPGVTSNKTLQTIEKISKDPRVEMVREDMFMFVDKKQTIRTTPKAVYPADLERNGTEYVPGRITVNFWKLPQSLEEFGNKNGGKLVELTETDIRLLSVLYETDNMDEFINNTLKDPHVRSVEPVITGRIA